MSQALAQIILTLILLGAAIAFEFLGETEIAIALVGAVLGQGVAVGVQVGVTTAKNGKEG